jgi:hypothetical protein
MGKHPGMYRGDKRRKELDRLKKQEEKRQRRLQKKDGEEKGPPIDWAEAPAAGEVKEPEPAEEA